MRISNFKPSIRNGSLIYYWAMDYFPLAVLGSKVRYIPCPWLSDGGLIINTLYGLDFLYFFIDSIP